MKSQRRSSRVCAVLCKSFCKQSFSTARKQELQYVVGDAAGSMPDDFFVQQVLLSLVGEKQEGRDGLAEKTLLDYNEQKGAQLCAREKEGIPCKSKTSSARGAI